jgi:hypothetical protein
MENLDKLSEEDYVPTKVHNYPQSIFRRDFTYAFYNVTYFMLIVMVLKSTF